MAYKNKEDYNKYIKNRYYERKQILLNQLGGKCRECGSIEKLEFDHVSQNSKKYSITRKLHGLPFNFLKKEVEKCQILCYFCHKKKHKQSNHGTRTMYTHHKCRCDLCRKANTAYHKKLKTRRSGTNEASKTS